MSEEKQWVEEEEEQDDGYPIDYSITSSPNDFNVKTIVDFIDAGTMRVPAFQRNYVWEKRRASRLIESIIMGLPIPQLFFYEAGKNQFTVIDGQQRLMTVYYFTKGRFPKLEKRAALRRYIDQRGSVPTNILQQDEYFGDFDLDFGQRYTNANNRLYKRKYSTLEDDDRTTFDLRAVRCIFIKQHKPEDNSAMYEIFNRLNTGGVNLTAQEIRSSLYHSEFYTMIAKANAEEQWRRLTTPDPDTRMKDMEILVRGFAMLLDEENYQGSMVRFLNNFSEKAKKYDSNKVQYLESVFHSFLKKTTILPPEMFQLQPGRFSASMYEAVFAAACTDAIRNNDVQVKNIDIAKFAILKNDQDFQKASRYRTAAKDNVTIRLRKAREILF